MLRPLAGCHMFPGPSACLIALCATCAVAGAATATKTVDIGAAGAAGAVIQTNYTVSENPTQNERARQNAERRGTQGRYDFDEALTYLKRSPRAANIIGRIEKADGRLVIVVNNVCNDGQRMGTGWKSVVDWDPHCAYRIANGTDSPSVILMHELVHTLHLFEDPEKYMNSSSHKNTLFDDDEERRTILYGESPVERELGELVRTNHHEGTPFLVNDPTVR